MPLSAWARAHFLLFLPWKLIRQQKLFKNGIHKQQFEMKLVPAFNFNGSINYFISFCGDCLYFRFSSQQMVEMNKITIMQISSLLPWDIFLQSQDYCGKGIETRTIIVHMSEDVLYLVYAINGWWRRKNVNMPKSVSTNNCLSK